MERLMDPTHLRIPWGTPEAQQAGILHDAVVSCNHLTTVHADRMHRVIGCLPDAVMRRIDECLSTLSCGGAGPTTTYKEPGSVAAYTARSIVSSNNLSKRLEPLVRSGIVVTESSLLRRICVLVDVEQTLYGGFDVHERTDVEDRGIHKVNLTANIPLVGPSLIIGHA
jgi:PemK-like, MazF-like toxin of type II toxin-antitoxin system